MDDLQPFIQNLCKRIGYTPDATEMEMLKKTTVREMSFFFDALSSGGTDKEILDKMLYYHRLRDQGKEKGFKVSDDIPAHEKKFSSGEGDVAAKNAMKHAKDETKTLEGGITVHVTPQGTYFLIAVTTPATSVSKERRAYNVKLDFSRCENCVVVADGHRSAKIMGTKVPESNMLLAEVELGGNRVTVGKLLPKWKNQGNGDANRFSSKVNYEVFVDQTPEERNDELKKKEAEEAAKKAAAAGPVSSRGNVKNLAAMFSGGPAKEEPLPPVVRKVPSHTPATHNEDAHLTKATVTPAHRATPAATHNPEMTKANVVKVESPSSSSVATPVKHMTGTLPAGVPESTPPCPLNQMTLVKIDESEVDGAPELKTLAENLELKVLTINHGYRFLVSNRDQRASFTVTFDLSKCDNLLIQPVGPDCSFGTKEGCPEGTVVVITVPPKFEKVAANLPVANFDKGSCEMKYVASIRKTIA